MSYIKIIHFLILICAVFFRLTGVRKKNGIHFFFPFYHMGGAEKVHSQIVSSIADQNPYIYIMGLSADSRYLNEFKFAGKVINFHGKLAKSKAHKYYYLAKIIAGIGDSSVVFGANTSYFYNILPFLPKTVYKIDLTHAFTDSDNIGYEIYSLAYIDFLDSRIVINEDTQRRFYSLYDKHGVDSKYHQRFKRISNYVEIPNKKPIRRINKYGLKVAYIGRGSPEKRIYLIGKIASTLNAYGFEFYFIGCNEDWVFNEDKNNCIFLGKVLTDEELANLYKSLDVVVMTSYREGSPLALMESMSFGAIPISTNVGGIGEFIIHGSNGFLVENQDNENEIIEDIKNTLLELSSDHYFRSNISNNCYNYAAKHFNKSTFVNNYRALLLNKYFYFQ
ncbi:glycosyltransferase family 4 protein [Methylomonas methanica]|uniref:Glycosyl transferase family 1 domain-containing protein n=1 Tax=Methylomonas methanica TaxID=421 RepID=A0A177MP44_METMH|nr:glycosyltransferase family 4 protein [Methylomonas methanica]OAI07546.1 hypothetical protein A1332_08665 [Methylomonas methanica]